ncbi:MAG TPA: S8 family serine peptidase [Gemmatimonadaceae bacterium]|nr:S8 family serine peptidase [Gemmatimonadaceae bacterium]
MPTGRRRLPWLVVSLAACARLGAPTSLARSPAAPDDGAPQATVDEPTASVALDRITKRAPLLNGVVRHAGTGRGVTVYVFDGGIDANHPELETRVRVGFDAFPSSPRVCNPHGTAVAGAIAGTTLGVARDAEIVDVKIINCRTARGSAGSLLAAARWVAEDHRGHPESPAVANWSFVVDSQRPNRAVERAAAVLLEAGIAVVASAGNFNVDACRVSPASSHRVMVVGASALTHDTAGGSWRDVRSDGTAYGPCVDLYAPGDSVLLPTVDGGRPGEGLWSGTSMAAGYVSGAAALVLERFHAASPQFVVATLRNASTVAMVDERRPSSAGRRRVLYIGGTLGP